MKPPYWDAATRALSRADPVLARLIAAFPGIHLARRGDPFTTLARAIVGQQISVKRNRSGTVLSRRPAASANRCGSMRAASGARG